MPIKKRRQRGTLLLLFFLVALLSSCGKSGVKTNHTVAENRDPKKAEARVSTFSIPLPGLWEGQGNEEKLYSGQTEVFLLLGPSGTVKEKLPRALALFFSTAFFAEQTILFPEETEEPYESGRIENRRLQEIWYYCGCNLAGEQGYFVYVTGNPEEREALFEYAKASLEGLRLF